MRIFGVEINLFGDSDPKGMPEHLFFGAVRLDYDTAQRADVTKQNYSICPRHWYVDALYVCRECKREFVFSANEQRFWYEEMHFWVDSKPRRCVACRKAERNRLELRKSYDSLITEALGRCPVEKKEEVLDIINELEIAEGEIPDRMKENRSTVLAHLKKATQ